MNAATAKKMDNETQEDFAALFEEFINDIECKEGDLVLGTVTGIENDFVIVDVPGVKSEGRIQKREFLSMGEEVVPEVGSEVEVYVDRFETATGETILSYEKALREKAWEDLEKAYEKEERVEGVIFGRVKGGFTVDLSGAVAFLPGSQVDIRPVRDVEPLIGVKQPFIILKMDRKRGNIVVSRRAILEESRAEARKEILGNIEEGAVLEGMVKNITDYGAFIDLGGIDGLLHVTDISWKRINHPSEVLQLGETIKVVVTKFNQENNRISLGMKQLESNPWDGMEERYPIGSRHKGVVSNITDYGAFVELEDGIEGLVHVSEMSWTKKNVHPGKIISTSQEVEVVVLSLESAKHRISLGMKQCEENPWNGFINSHKVGDEIEGEIRNITDFGLFVALNEEIEGLVHASDLSWDLSSEEALQGYKKGDVVKAKVLEMDIEKERIALGIKQLTGDATAEAAGQFKKGTVITCTVTKVRDEGLDVEVGDDKVIGFIRRADLSRDRSEQRPDRFGQGDRLDAAVISFNKRDRKLTLSVKALEIEEEKKAIAEYGSTDSGASLGDILGAALNQSDAEAEKPAKKTKAKKADADKDAS
jgi:small subunit ribosomal protein S1